MPARSRIIGKAGRPALREEILAVAADMFIRRGYNAVSFLMIAKELGITHSNIHYYFKTKADLAETVLDAYVAGTIADFRIIWTNESSDLQSRFIQSREWIWRQYVKFNPGGIGGHNWGLLARFAGEADVLTPDMRACLARTLTTMDALIETGIDIAVRHGELSADVPKHVLVLQISSLIHTSRHLTRIEGNFERLDELLRWTLDVMLHVYGPAKPVHATSSVVARQAGSSANQPQEKRRVSQARR
jgi:AcrR family transcriptional regulator